MTTVSDVPLILGGHSFLEQLGNQPKLTTDQQIELVAACLDNGISWFDTTYQPERTALGWALHALRRRDDATIIVWNFFRDFDDDGEVGPPDYYQPHHIELMLKQLRTDVIDRLVVHPLDDPRENARQEALAVSWKEQGLVRTLGVWAPGPDADAVYANSPYRFMVRPYNVRTPEAPEVFAACKRMGWETIACSPFVRGWELDRLVNIAPTIEKWNRDAEQLRADLADAMLRYSLFQPNVNRLIVAMRDVRWVAANAKSARQGPPTQRQWHWLDRLCSMTHNQ